MKNAPDRPPAMDRYLLLLPADLHQAVTDTATLLGTSKADLIRKSIAAGLPVVTNSAER